MWPKCVCIDFICITKVTSLIWPTIQNGFPQSTGTSVMYNTTKSGLVTRPGITAYCQVTNFHGGLLYYRYKPNCHCLCIFISTTYVKQNKALLFLIFVVIFFLLLFHYFTQFFFCPDVISLLSLMVLFVSLIRSNPPLSIDGKMLFKLSPKYE